MWSSQLVPVGACSADVINPLGDPALLSLLLLLYLVRVGSVCHLAVVGLLVKLLWGQPNLLLLLRLALLLG